MEVYYICCRLVVSVAQLVRVPDCDSGCRRFESDHSPSKRPAFKRVLFVCILPEIRGSLIFGYESFGISV